MRRGVFLTFAAMVCMGIGSVSAQPPGISKQNLSPRLIKIGLGWGEQLKPPVSLRASLRNLQRYAEQSDLLVESQPQLFLSSSLSGFAVIFITSDQQFQLTNTEKKNLKKFIDGGGLLVADNAKPSQNKGPAESALLQMINEIAGSGQLYEIPNDSPIFYAPFKMDGPPIGAEMQQEKILDVPKLEAKSQAEWDIEAKIKAGKSDEITDDERSQASEAARAREPIERYSINSTGSQPLKGVKIGDRIAVVFCNKGYLQRWSEFSNNDPQLKFGVNLLSYALTHKDDLP